MNSKFNDFLEKVEHYLKPLPLTERMDIIKEISSQIVELENSGKTPEEILERLGSPKELAKAYLGSLISQEKSLSRNKILALVAYYTVASLSGIIVVPVLFICAPVFMFSGILAFVATLVKMLNYVLGLGLPFMDKVGFAIGGFETNPVLEFLVGVPIAALLFAAGWGCWKLLKGYIKLMRDTRQNINSK